MSAFKDFFVGKRTYIVAAIGLLTAVQGWADMDGSVPQLFEAVWLPFAAIFLRKGVASSGK